MLVSVFEWRRFTEILHVSAHPLKIRVEEWNIELGNAVLCLKDVPSF
jgi:hypothetical protein